MNPTLRVPALAEQPRCPDQRCHRIFVSVETEVPLRGLVKCTRKSCEQRWFVEPLDAGDIRAQLLDRYDDAGIVTDLMVRLHLPNWIGRPMYLQIPTSGELWDDYVKSRVALAPIERTKRFLRQAIGAFVLQTGRREGTAARRAPYRF